jgi:hypothetical protein
MAIDVMVIAATVIAGRARVTGSVVPVLALCQL